MLVSGAVTVIITALFLLFGQSAVPTAAAFGASVLLLGLALRKRLSRFYTVVFAGVCILAVSLANFLFLKIYELPAYEFAKTSHDVIAYVCELPQNLSDDYYFYVFKTVSSDGKDKSVKFTLTSTTDMYELYDTVAFENAEFSKVGTKASEKAYTDKAFLKLSYYGESELLFKKSPTPYYYCLKIKAGFISNMEKYLSSSSAALLTGMTFGDKSELPLSLKKAFSTCGVSHILAVSGLHVSLWCGVLFSILKLFGASDRLKSIIPTVFLLLLCTVSAFTPSVVRASLMSGLVFIAPFFNRRADTLNSLGFAITVILALDPYTLINPSFVLSVLATAGVAFAAFAETVIKKPTLKRRLTRKLYEFFVSGTLVSVCASIFTLPACAYYFKSFSIVAPLANFFVVTPSFYAMVTGVFLSAMAFIPLKQLEGVLGVLFSVPEAIERFIALAVRIIAKIPFASLPAGILTVAAVLISAALAAVTYYIFFVLHRKKGVLRVVSSLLCAALFIASLFLEILPLSINRKITVVSSEGLPAVITQTGREIALLGVPQSAGVVSEFLPQTDAQKFTYLYVTDDSLTYSDFAEYVHDYEPLCIVSASDAFKNCENLSLETGCPAPTCEKEFSVGRKIYVETVDTNDFLYAIISTDKTSVAVSFSEYNDISFADGRGDIAVICESQAEDFDIFCETLVICTASGMSESKKAMLSDNCRRLVVLSEGESVTINI